MWGVKGRENIKNDIIQASCTKLSDNFNLMWAFPENRKRKEPLNLFHGVRITWITQPEKGNIKKENYRPVSLINKGTKIFNKTLANWSQQYVKNIKIQG